MISVRPLLIFTACLPLVACVAAPYSRTDSESSAPVSLQGYTVFPGQRITIQAVDQNTGNLVTRGTAISATSGFPTQTLGGTNYSIYPWSFDAGVLPANFWSPQSIVADLATSQGHLELFASADGNNFYTFSPAAWNSVVLSGEDPVTAGVQYSDGKSTVLFDQSGVGSSLGSLWVTVQGMISDSHSPYYSPVAWSVGYYTVEGGKKIYGLICAPTTGGPYPVVIYNHGGTDNTNGGNITGVVTAAGWTAQPPGAPDGLGQCLDWAKRGWVFATSSYRGEAVSITSSSPQFPSSTWTSDGNVEFCMGEVTDVMALTDLLVYHASAITVGSASEKVPINVNGKVLMYGYSHGGWVLGKDQRARIVHRSMRVELGRVGKACPIEDQPVQLGLFGHPNERNVSKFSSDVAATDCFVLRTAVCANGRYWKGPYNHINEAIHRSVIERCKAKAFICSDDRNGVCNTQPYRPRNVAPLLDANFQIKTGMRVEE